MKIIELTAYLAEILRRADLNNNGGKSYMSLKKISVKEWRKWAG